MFHHYPAPSRPSLLVFIKQNCSQLLLSKWLETFNEVNAEYESGRGRVLMNVGKVVVRSWRASWSTGHAECNRKWQKYFSWAWILGMISSISICLETGGRSSCNMSWVKRNSNTRLWQVCQIYEYWTFPWRGQLFLIHRAVLFFQQWRVELYFSSVSLSVLHTSRCVADAWSALKTSWVEEKIKDQLSWWRDYEVEELTSD